MGELSVQLFFNDLSVHEQFHDTPSFREALCRVMAMRGVARDFKREIHCHYEILNRKSMPMRGTSMPKAIGQLNPEKRRAAMVWMANGPFWDVQCMHSPDDCLQDDCLECEDKAGKTVRVMDSAVGEAAYRGLHGSDVGLVSFMRSDWDFSPICVRWLRNEAKDIKGQKDICNWRDAAALKAAMENLEPPVQSWKSLRDTAVRRFEYLTFDDTCFAPLMDGVPFMPSSARCILDRLDVLNRLAGAVDADGVRTEEGHRIYQQYFTGDNAWFSDSSDTEKRKYKDKLTFPHPEGFGTLFCPWHGKTPNQTLRLHFSWPIQAKEPLYVMYIGPKLTKR